MSQANFLNNLYQDILLVSSKYKIFPSVIAAQASLESNWGNSKLAKECNNLFGIKADKSWKGEKKAYSTKEYDKMGTILNTVSYFRKYTSQKESLRDHGEFLNKNNRYKAIFEANNYKEQVKEIHLAGYATDPAYAEKLIRIIEQNNLQKWDKYVSFSNNYREIARTHTVKKGETLSEIASKYKLSIADIVELNRIKNPNLIFPGEVLNLNTSKG